MPPTLNIAGRKFVVIPADEYRQLKAKAARTGKTPRGKRPRSHQERGDIAESARRLADPARIPADQVLLKLANNPRPSGSVKLAGGSNLYRIRIGDYRVVYRIDDAHQLVEITIVAHRREVYRGL